MLSCITRAGQHSSVPIEQAWLLQPRTMPGTRYCARALLFHRLVPFSFDPRMRYIPRMFDRLNLYVCPARERRSFSSSYIPLVSLSAPLVHTVFRVIKYHPGPPTTLLTTRPPDRFSTPALGTSVELVLRMHYLYPARNKKSEITIAALLYIHTYMYDTYV